MGMLFVFRLWFLHFVVVGAATSRNVAAEIDRCHSDDNSLLQRSIVDGSGAASSRSRTEDVRIKTEGQDGRQSESGRLMAVYAISRHTVKSVEYDFSSVTDVVLDQDFGTPKSGMATPHGLEYARLVGAYYRKLYGAELFGSTSPCEPGSDAYCASLANGVAMLADTDSRDIETGTAWISGFAPSCSQHISVRADDLMHELLNEGKPDMLYPDCTYADEEEVSGLYGSGAPDAWIRTNLVAEYEYLNKLIPLKASACPEHEQNCTLIDLPNSWKGGYWTTWEGSWSDAGHMAVVLQTQFVNGNPVYMNMTEKDITFIYRIATEVWMTYKNSINARRFAGPNYAAFILSEMAKIGETPRITWLMAHDVNVAFAAELLNANLNTPSYRTSGGNPIFLGAVILEVRDLLGLGVCVQAFQQGNTMEQIRTLNVTEMLRSQIPISWCSAPLNCPIGEFYNYTYNWINMMCAAPSLTSRLEKNPKF